MSGTSRIPKILLIDSNVYFSKRLADALKKEGFQVLASTQPAFALTTLEYDTPTAVVCATNMRDMGALEIATIIKADPKNANLPIIALGDGSQRALMEAFQAGCDDYIDRQRQPAVIASHIRNIIISKSEGFQPTQMLAQADTSLSGSLTHHDLPGVLQMLGQARQTGALHINAGATDAVLRAPGHPYTARLIESLPSIRHRYRRLPVIPGRPPSLADALPACPFFPRCSYGSQPACTDEVIPVQSVSDSHWSVCVLSPAELRASEQRVSGRAEVAGSLDAINAGPEGEADGSASDPRGL